MSDKGISTESKSKAQDFGKQSLSLGRPGVARMPWWKLFCQPILRCKATKQTRQKKATYSGLSEADHKARTFTLCLLFLTRPRALFFFRARQHTARQLPSFYATNLEGSAEGTSFNSTNIFHWGCNAQMKPTQLYTEVLIINRGKFASFPKRRVGQCTTTREHLQANIRWTWDEVQVPYSNVYCLLKTAQQ